MLLGTQAAVAGSGAAPPVLVPMALETDGATISGAVADFYSADEITAQSASPRTMWRGARFASTGSKYLCAGASATDDNNQIFWLSQPTTPSPGNDTIRWRTDAANSRTRGYTSVGPVVDVNHIASILVDGTASAHTTASGNTTFPSSSATPNRALAADQLFFRRGSARVAGIWWAIAVTRTATTQAEREAVIALIAAGDLDGTRDALLALDPTGAGLWWPTSETTAAGGIVDQCGNYANMTLPGAIDADIVSIP